MTIQSVSQQYAGIEGALPAVDVARQRSLLLRVGDWLIDLLEQYGRHTRMAGPATQTPVAPDTWLPWTGYPAGHLFWRYNRYRW